MTITKETFDPSTTRELSTQDLTTLEDAELELAITYWTEKAVELKANSKMMLANSAKNEVHRLCGERDRRTRWAEKQKHWKALDEEFKNTKPSEPTSEPSYRELMITKTAKRHLVMIKDVTNDVVTAYCIRRQTENGLANLNFPTTEHGMSHAFNEAIKAWQMGNG